MDNSNCIEENLYDDRILVYTDGSCLGNPGPGGWAVIILVDGEQVEISGRMQFTTNNRMELMAAVEALKFIKKNSRITLYTDSIYVKSGMTSWLGIWKSRRWLTSDSKPVKNVDLWKQLDILQYNHDISWNWIKAHSGNHFNEMADALSRKESSLAEEERESIRKYKAKLDGSFSEDDAYLKSDEHHIVAYQTGTDIDVNITIDGRKADIDINYVESLKK